MATEKGRTGLGRPFMASESLSVQPPVHPGVDKDLGGVYSRSRRLFGGPVSPEPSALGPPQRGLTLGARRAEAPGQATRAWTPVWGTLQPQRPSTQGPGPRPPLPAPPVSSGAVSGGVRDSSECRTQRLPAPGAPQGPCAPAATRGTGGVPGEAAWLPATRPHLPPASQHSRLQPLQRKQGLSPGPER